MYATTTEEQAAYDALFDCSVFASPNENTSTNARSMFMHMSFYGNDQTGYDWGFVAANSTVCVEESDFVNITGGACTPPDNTDYVCSSDFNKYISAVNSVYSKSISTISSSFMTNS